MQSSSYLYDGFAFDSGQNSYWDCWTLNRDTVEKSIAYYSLGSTQVISTPRAGEWGYAFFLPKGNSDGNGNSIANGGFDTEPVSRADALDQIKSWLFSVYPIGDEILWESMNGHYLWQHYACEWGCSSVGAEVGETISSTQSHIAFARGAAKQYGLPWFTQFSFWHQGYINDYTGNAVWGASSTATGGHSPSLYKRTFTASYMGGASHFYPEACSVINFTSELTENGCYELSPIGETSKELYAFSSKNSDIGINYVPFGIVLDYYHGMFPGDEAIASKKVFQAFDYTDGDNMTYKLLDSFFPGSFKTIGYDESTYQVNGPYGDTCDVLLQNASQQVLDSYPCLILSGNITLSAAEIARYKSYVQRGGTLILNTAYLQYFPEYEKAYSGGLREDISAGAGTVIIYGPDYSVQQLDSIIKEQLQRFVPFSFSDDVEYLVNVKKNSLIVTLINNEGYYYDRVNGEYIDTTKTKKFFVRYTGKDTVKTATELWSEKKITSSEYVKNQFEVSLAPGEVKVIEFSF